MPSTFQSMTVLSLIGLVDSISYMAIAPSLIFYVLQVGGDKEMYGLIMSIFSFASFCGKPVYGIWVDKAGNKFRTPYIASFVIAIFGGILYFFGNAAPLSITRGRTHDYLGMKLDFYQDLKVNITMIYDIKQMLDDLPIDMDSESAMPDGRHLFTVAEQMSQLYEKNAMFFHCNMEKILFLCKVEGPDLQTAVGFLTMQLRSLDMDDYKKLVRVMKYL